MRQPFALVAVFLLTLGVVIWAAGELSPCMAAPQDPSAEAKKQPLHTNRLIREKSPYLLQHAHNPVDWYPWGEEAFRKAKDENKPIFLSIGYSTCHWCHVMEEESFSDPDVAELMNASFVSIKVDREERPDIDSVYMTVAQLMTGRGGWPLNVLLTPDKEPFFAATYIPKGDRFGQPGMLTLVPQVWKAWNEQRDAVMQSAAKVTDALQLVNAGAPGNAPQQKILEEGLQQLAARFDSQRGGFLPAPKFPIPQNYMFLLRYWKRTGNAKSLEMVETSLEAMRRGGMFDQVGFGFHRYSTDPSFLVPHFEKMLYDQAMLAMAYTETYQATGKESYRRAAEEILEYVLRDMRSPQGGFYSAEDADSEGEEGKFYLWTDEEIRKLLGADADLFIEIYGVKKEGNYQDPVGEETYHRNILHLARSIDDVAREKNIKPDELRAKLEASRQRLFLVRERRIHPHKDDKILTDWNGLTIAALAKSAQAFNEPRYAEAAQKAASFLLTAMRPKRGKLLHRYRDGEAGIEAHLEDYAFLVWGLLELYQATWETQWLSRAIELTQEAIAKFEDDQTGGFFLTADESEALIVRPKESNDTAIPSGNSVMMLNLLRIGRITGNPKFEEKAERIAKAFSQEISRSPSFHGLMLTALDFGFGPSLEIVVVGDPRSEQTRTMLGEIVRPFIPNKVVLLRAAKDDPKITKIAGFTKAYRSIRGKPTAYVCTNYVCKLPTTDITLMRQQLGLEKGKS